MLPLVKLGYLGIRTLSKPLANLVKSSAAEHPKFRKFCIAIAQMYHRGTSAMQWSLYPSSSSKAAQFVRPLNEENAIHLGANILGEAVIFGVAAGVMAVEYASSSRSSKEAKQELERRFTTLETQVKDLQDAMEGLQSTVIDILVQTKQFEKEHIDSLRKEEEERLAQQIRTESKPKERGWWPW